jgi:tRNA threonylcarbamoyladenosine biosynthesis protein TsaB
MARILNIETATALCSVALAVDGKVKIYRETLEDKSHAAKLPIFIEEILRETQLTIQDLDAVATGMGPGSYTGLRIGVSTAKGLCYGAHLPLIAVSTLRILADHVIQLKISSIQLALKKPDTILCPMLDARRMEVFTSMLNTKCNEIKNVTAEIIDKNSYKDLLEKHTVIFFGSGMPKCKDMLMHQNAIFIDDIYPHASSLAIISEEKYHRKEFENMAYFEPFYLKDFVATTSKKNLLI